MKHPFTRPAARLGLLAAAVAMLAAGCMSIRQQTVPLDAPAAAASAPALPVCARDGLGALRTLRLTESCYAQVRAADWYSTSNLWVKPGWTLEVVVPPGQRWYDADRINTAPQGDEGSALMKLFSGLKRHPEPYFALMAAVVHCQAPAGDAPARRACVAESGQTPTWIAAPNSTLLIKAKGELVLYANDATLPGPWRELFYRNNDGRIWVRLTLVSTGR